MSPAALPSNLPPGYPLGWEHHVVLADGDLAFVRPAVPEDAQELEALFARVSPESRRLRSFSGRRNEPADRIAGAVHVDYGSRMAFAAFSEERLIGFASYVCGREPGQQDAAETAFLVDDVHQGRGLGTLLLEHLAAFGAERGLHRLTALVLAENHRMLEVFRDAGFPKTSDRRGPEILVCLDIDPSAHSRKRIETRHRKALMAWDRRRKRGGPSTAP